MKTSQEIAIGRISLLNDGPNCDINYAIGF
jgi:hypothetical protein